MKLSNVFIAIVLSIIPFKVLLAQTQPEVFNVSVYEGIYPDIFNAYGTGNTQGATNHWTSIGLPGGRRASIIFDPAYYLQNNADVRALYGPQGYAGALQHFLQIGLPQGRRGSLEFDVQYYMSHNQQQLVTDGITTNLGAADHFLNRGLPVLGLQGSADFSVQNYINLYPDVGVVYGPSDYQDATLHWLRRGKGEGRAGIGAPVVSSECTAPSVTNPRIFIGLTPPFGTDASNDLNHPLDGTIATNFDTILRTRSESGVQNLIVCLLNGTFQTDGAGDYDFFPPAGPHHNSQTPSGFTVNTNWHIHGQGINATTVQLADFQQNIADWSFPAGTGLEIVFMNHNFDVSGVEISDLTIDDNYAGVHTKHAGINNVNLLAIYLNSNQGNHHLHNLNILHTAGEVAKISETFEGFPVIILSPNASPLQNSGNLIEYVLMSDDPQSGKCTGSPPNNPPGRCTGIDIDNAAAEVRYNVVNGIENGFGGFLMPLVWFHDNFAFNNPSNGYITDSLNNRDVLIQFNEIRNPGSHGILIGGAQTYNNFQLQYNTVSLYQTGSIGILFNGNVTDSTVINNNIIQAISFSGGKGISFSGTGNSNNQFAFNQIASGLGNGALPPSNCAFDNWNESSVQLTNFPNTQGTPCVAPPQPGVLASQVDSITNSLDVFFVGFDQNIHTLTWNNTTGWAQSSFDVSYPAAVPNAIAGGSVTNIIDTVTQAPESYFIGTDQHVYQLYWSATNGWLGFDLSNNTGAQNASPGAIASMMDTITESPETYYVGTDQHLHQLYFNLNGGWHTFDVSASAGGANVAANGSLTSIVDTLVGSPEVYYVGVDQHIHQMSWNSTSGWHNFDLSAMAGAPAASAGGVTALVDTVDGALEVYYVGTDQHVHQLQWSGSSGWHTFDVSSYLGATAAVAGLGTLTSMINNISSALEIYYVGTDQHVHQLSWSASNGWRTADITVTAGAMNIIGNGRLSSLSDTLSTASDVFYAGTDQHVHQLQWKSATGWHDTVLPL